MSAVFTRRLGLGEPKMASRERLRTVPAIGMPSSRPRAHATPLANPRPNAPPAGSSTCLAPSFATPRENSGNIVTKQANKKVLELDSFFIRAQRAQPPAAPFFIPDFWRGETN